MGLFSRTQPAAPKLLNVMPSVPTIRCASESVGLALWGCDHGVGWLGSIVCLGAVCNVCGEN